MSIGSEVKSRALLPLVVRKKRFVFRDQAVISDSRGEGQPEMDFFIACIQHVVLIFQSSR